VENLNRAIEEATQRYTTDELIALFTKATIPISKVNGIGEVLEDPYVKDEILTSTDPKTGTTIYLAPPPLTNSYIKSIGKELPFPPRFGEQNEEIYNKKLGYSMEKLEEFKSKGII